MKNKVKREKKINIYIQIVQFIKINLIKVLLNLKVAK
jgi:hypothetical protein